MRSFLTIFAAVLCLALGCGRHSGSSTHEDPRAPRAAPGFDGATAWLNVDHAITLGELRGKVVIVDFWTSCCINCIHTLPVLAAVERKYASRPVAVIGVHSAKFDVERERDRLREIVSEYSIVHPVAIDGAMKLWDAWGISAWPTVLVLDASGRIVWTGSGEPSEGAIERAVDAALDQGEKAGALSAKPLAGLRREADDSGPLSFPGKVVVLADGSLAISDSGHHRVVFATPEGAVLAVVGSGLAGFADGTFEQASFRKPQGLAEAGDLVYVADTENHAIRAIDRHTHAVSTVAGTGEIGAGPLGSPAPARATKLRSPWDLAFAGDVLYVALAGSHQIAALRPAAGTIEAFAGDGEERRLDGAGISSSFAQPSGLATDGKSLFVADSETSSVREVSLATRDVHTILGQDLFVFGDVDGPAPRVRLEHPVGIAWSPGALWVADTYNSKIKRVDLQTGMTRTVLGGRDHAAIFEPEGLAVHAGQLFIADTKHHRILSVAVPEGSPPGEPRALALRGLTAPSVGVALAPQEDRAAKKDERIVQDDVPLAPTGDTVVHFDWKPPAGTGINEEAPFRITWTSSDGLASEPTPLVTTGAKVQHGFDLSITPIPGTPGGRLEGEISLVLCDVSTHLVCVPVRRAIEVSFRVATTAQEKPVVWIPLPAARP